MLQLLGENGVGKSTLIRTIAGLTQPVSGTIQWNGEPIKELGSDYHAHLQYLGHKIGLCQSLTARENLMFFDHFKIPHGSFDPSNSDMGNPDIDQTLQYFNATEFANLPCYQLSAGQKQRIALARIQRSGSQLWLLDEPATALDQMGVQLLQEIMLNHCNQGGMIIFTSHQQLDLDMDHLNQIELRSN